MQRLTSAVAVMFAMALFAAPAYAVSITPGLALDADGNLYFDTTHQAAQLTDTDGDIDNATAFLFLELGAFAPDNTFGIYGFSSAGGVVTLGNSLEVFSGAAAAVTSRTLEFDLVAGTVKNQFTGAVANIGTTFGFYISTPEQATFYSHTSLNADSVDHFLMFDTRDHASPSLLGSNIVLGIEDLFGGGDFDYDDMVVGVSDVKPVPEPGTMALIGSGLVGLYGARRRRAAQRN